MKSKSHHSANHAHTGPNQQSGGPAARRDNAQDLIGNAAMLQHIRKQGRGPAAAEGEEVELPYRTEMEEAFGEDLSGVESFSGPKSTASNNAIGAEAFAQVDQIVFGKQTPSKDTVAHEVAHVLQHRRGDEDGVHAKGSSTPGDSAEQEAEQAASAVTSGESVRIAQAPTGEVQGSWLSTIGDTWDDSVEALGDMWDWGTDTATDWTSSAIDYAGDAASAGYDAVSDTAQEVAWTWSGDHAWDKSQEGSNELGENQLYAHGGFMGAVSGLWSDAQAGNILRHLTPDDYWAVEGVMSSPVASEIGEAMTAVENNPVMAAYGQLMSQQAQLDSGGEVHDVPLEWDIWIDASDPRSLDAARICHGDVGDMAGARVPGADEMPEDVAASPSVHDWLFLYGRALQMFAGTESYDATTEESGNSSGEETRSQAKTGLAGLTGESGVFLDIKSTWSTSADVAALVDQLELEGIQVKGVGSFSEAQLEGVEASLAYRFFHGVDHLEGNEDTLQAGEQVMINLGSLLEESGGTWALDEVAWGTLVSIAVLKQVHVGGYVQETELSPEAHEILVALVNDHPTILDLGYAYGNIDGQASQGPTGSGFGSQSKLEWTKDSSAQDYPQAVSGSTTRYGLALALLQAAGASSKELESASQVAAQAVARGMFDSAGTNTPTDLRFSDAVNRAEAAKIIVRAFGIAELASGSILRTFTDLEAGHWAAPFVYGSVLAGVLQGYGDGSYDPAGLLEHKYLNDICSKAASGGGTPVFDPTVAVEGQTQADQDSDETSSDWLDTVMAWLAGGASPSLSYPGESAGAQDKYDYYLAILQLMGHGGDVASMPGSYSLVGIRGCTVQGLDSSSYSNQPGINDDMFVLIGQDAEGNAVCKEYPGSTDPGQFETLDANFSDNTSWWDGSENWQVQAGVYEYAYDGTYSYGGSYFRMTDEQISTEGVSLNVDKDGDDSFTGEADEQRVEMNNSAFLIHRGSDSTDAGVGAWSAGCQTITGTTEDGGHNIDEVADYLKQNPDQTFNYILIDGSELLGALAQVV